MVSLALSAVAWLSAIVGVVLSLFQSCARLAIVAAVATFCMLTLQFLFSL